MSHTKRERRRQRHARPWADALHQVLTPALWRHAHQAVRTARRTPKPPGPRPHHRNRPPRRARPRPNRRGDRKPWILVLVRRTGCGGDTEDRVQNACDVATAARPKRRRTGITVTGFQKARARRRRTVRAILARDIRDQVLRHRGPARLAYGVLPLGGDGTRWECPRTDAWLRHRDPAGNADRAPTLWVTAWVHLTTGVPWSGRVDTGTARERPHRIPRSGELPAAARVIRDAGSEGLERASALCRAGRRSWIRLSSTGRLRTEDPVERASDRDGRASDWPLKRQEAGRPPLPVRMIRVAGRSPETDVWLRTHVRDPERLSVAPARRFDRMRWEDGGMFRTYKRTLHQVKRISRALRAVRRAASGSLLATHLVLASGALALPRKRCRAAAARVGTPRAAVAPPPCRAREVWTAFRGCLRACRREDRTPLPPRWEPSDRARRERPTPTQKRQWPRRKPHGAPTPPQVLTMTEEQKSLLAQHNSDSEAA